MLTWLVIAIGLVCVFLVLNRLTTRRNAKSNASDLILALENFLYGWNHDTWNLIIYDEINDPYLENIRQRCLEVGRQFPPENKGQDFCNEKGREEIRNILDELKSHQEQLGRTTASS